MCLAVAFDPQHLPDEHGVSLSAGQAVPKGRASKRVSYIEAYTRLSLCITDKCVPACMVDTQMGQ